MLGMFNSVKPYVVPKPKVDVPRPDNAVFRLHYKASLNCADQFDIAEAIFARFMKRFPVGKYFTHRVTGCNDWWNVVQ